MFGFSFSEIVVIALVALIVTGPKELPKMLRKLGQWAGRLRRMATELRVQSGIDDALHAEGLGQDLVEIQRLARGELVDARALLDVRATAAAAAVATAATAPSAGSTPSAPTGYGIEPLALEREYPPEGVDTRGALPDTAHVYDDALPASTYATSPLWLTGEEAPQ